MNRSSSSAAQRTFSASHPAAPDGGVWVPYSESSLWRRAGSLLLAGAVACLALAATAAWHPAHAGNVTWSVGVQSPGVVFQAAAPMPAPVMVYPAPVVVPAPVYRSYAPVERVEYWDDRWRHHHHHHRHPQWRGYYEAPPVVVQPAPRHGAPWYGGY